MECSNYLVVCVCEAPAVLEGVVEGGWRGPGQRGEAQHGVLHVLHPEHRGR